MHVPASQLSQVRWRRSSHSGAQGNCVELAAVRVAGTGRVALRNSRRPDDPALLLTPDDVAALLDRVRAGWFDEGGASGATGAGDAGSAGDRPS